MNRTLRRLRIRTRRLWSPPRRRPVSSIEAVVTSVDYDDFLSITLPMNRDQLERIVVVATPADEATREVCAHYDVECVTTEEFHRGGAVFNKGRGLNVGLARLEQLDWILVLDADIVLPPDFRTRISQAMLDAETLYGAARLRCEDYETWRSVRDGQLAWSDLPLAPVTHRHDQFLPLGFFQLFHASCRAFRREPRFPVEFSTARKADTVFAKRWRWRSRLPSNVLHLGPLAENHQGRVSPRAWRDRYEASGPQPRPRCDSRRN